MKNSQTEMKQLFGKLKLDTPTISNTIYLSDGLYLSEDGDILEDILQ